MVLSAAASYPSVIEEPPLLCIEVVPPDDKLADLVIRAGDYLTMGVPISWILDPETKRAFLYSNQGTIESSEPALSHGQIELPIAELFSEFALALNRDLTAREESLGSQSAARTKTLRGWRGPR